MANHEVKVNKSILTSLLIAVVPFSVMSMPLVLNQSAQASCAGSGPCDDTPPAYVRCETNISTCVEDLQGYKSPGNKVLFRWPNSKADFYHVRYRVNGGEKQVKIKTRFFVVNKAKPNSTYRISVQGCNSNFLASSSCSEWQQESFSTDAQAQW